MKTLRTLIIFCSLAGLMAFGFVNGCKDLGSELPPIPAITRIIPDSGAVGDQIKIEGVNFGDSRGNGLVRFGSVAATQYDEWKTDEIKVRIPPGAISGLVKVVTDGGESNAVFFKVILLPGSFGVANKNVTLSVNDSLLQAISGGTPPYTFVSKGDTTRAGVSIVVNSLLIRALAVGSSIIIIRDSGTPQLRDTINVSVAVAALSFAGDIQPIFTNSCVNAGCHPGGGGPFSLLSSVSYDNLVNVQATSGCNTEKRVLPGNPTSSVLYKRISGTTCGTQMPKGNPALLPAAIQKIADWITQGALRN